MERSYVTKTAEWKLDKKAKNRERKKKKFGLTKLYDVEKRCRN